MTTKNNKSKRVFKEKSGQIIHLKSLIATKSNLRRGLHTESLQVIEVHAWNLRCSETTGRSIVNLQ